MKHAARYLFPIALVFFASLGIALAEEKTTLSPCDLRVQFETLESTESDSASSGDITNELRTRKQILSAILECSARDVVSLTARLNELSLEKQGLGYLKEQLSRDLDQALEYHELQKARIGDLGLYGTKEFARQFLAWRFGNYGFIVERINSLILWEKNNTLLTIGNNRLAHIRKTVTTLSLIADEELERQFQIAERQLTSALEAHEGTRQSLERGAPPEESLALLKSSLESLAAMYQTFSDLSDRVKKIPLP